MIKRLSEKIIKFLGHLKRSQKVRYTFLSLFILWPFMSLLLAIKFNQIRISKIIFILFCAFFGYTFVIHDDVENAPDSARYATELSELYTENLSFTQFWDNLYVKYIDVYQPFITWSISKITDNPRVLFAVFGLFFGVFYANNIWQVFKYTNNPNASIIIFVLTYASLNPIWNINGVRMYTAFQVFLFGLLLYVINSKRISGNILIFLSILIHFSFIIPVSIFLFYTFLPKRQNILLLIFLVSLFISELNISILDAFVKYLPDVFQFRYNYYTNDDYIKFVSDNINNTSWHIVLSNIVIKYGISAFLIILNIYYIKLINLNFLVKEFNSLSLYFLSWANLFSIIPSGGRFLTIAYSISLIFFIFLSSQIRLTKQLRYIEMIIAFSFVIFLIHSLRIGLDYISLNTILSNPIIELFIVDIIPVL